MNKQNYIDHAEQALLHTYNRFPVVLDHGEGVYLYDTDGKKYLDFAAGIAVCAFGYGKKEYNDALKNQVDKLLHTSNLYYNVPTMEAAEKALAAADMDRIFFTNSGTEAIEGALKAAKICLQQRWTCRSRSDRNAAFFPWQKSWCIIRNRNKTLSGTF